ncbi:MAG: DUF1501 domain-containing protein [Bryobacterales bacterium]|nr:DUF1501 domain-containing protein [Bryobacterales bacterium]
MASETQRRQAVDHHRDCFPCWVAGACWKPGFSYSASGDVGYKPAATPITVYDFHATALHLLGLDYEKLTYRRTTACVAASRTCMATCCSPSCRSQASGSAVPQPLQ